MQLLYRSQSLIGSGSALEMSGILDQARPLNARDDITGVLTAINGTFVQIIEGAEEAIDDLLRRLSSDRRHEGLMVLERRPAKRRAFGDWDMVSPRLAGLELATLAVALNEPRVGLDRIIPILSGAVARQEDLLEGRSTTHAAEARRNVTSPDPGSQPAGERS